MSLKDRKDELPVLQRIGGRYDRLGVQKIVEAIEGGMSRSEVCLIYGLSRTTICDWMREYGSAQYQAGRKGQLNQAQKRSMIRSIREGRLTLREAKLAYNMPSYRAILSILREQQENAELGVDMKKKGDHLSGAEQEEEEKKALRKALEEAQLKIKALNTLIDVAEDQFKIAIRKKPGAKRSKR